MIGRRKIAKHVSPAVTDGRSRFARKIEAIAAEALLDGIHILRTSLTAEHTDIAATVLAYQAGACRPNGNDLCSDQACADGTHTSVHNTTAAALDAPAAMLGRNIETGQAAARRSHLRRLARQRTLAGHQPRPADGCAGPTDARRARPLVSWTASQ